MEYQEIEMMYLSLLTVPMIPSSGNAKTGRSAVTGTGRTSKIQYAAMTTRTKAQRMGPASFGSSFRNMRAAREGASRKIQVFQKQNGARVGSILGLIHNSSFLLGLIRSIELKTS